MASLFTSCRACQRQILSTFTGVAIPASHVSRLAAVSRRGSSTAKPISRRPFHASSRVWQQQDSPKDSSLDETAQTSPPSSESTSSSSSTHVPWYLQVSPPEPLSTSLTPNLAAQALPPLPEDPPTVLSPILQHLSITIGLDNLTIIDLRGLNPPSALGANLLMILGTARSEKHLNTSADRFCRWLRSTYKLRPYADGLLGRQELKLKLRRRNKKMKLAQSVGNTMFGEKKDIDDGITTGWVCCNLGDVSLAVLPEGEESIEEHETISAKDQERFLEVEDEYTNPGDDYQIVGFGVASNAPRIVVQMFTEEKRLEMDLEGMWEARLKRREAKDQKRADEYEDDLFDAARFRERPEDQVQRRASRI